jgi:dsRNA-specific ribonuclease
VECRIADLSLAVPGAGGSRRAAEQAAAEAAGQLLSTKYPGTVRGSR